MIVAGLDTETTGILKPEHRIIELCLQKWDFNPSTFEAKLIRTDTWRIHPERSIEAGAYAVHKISLDDLAGRPNWLNSSPYILDAMKGVDLFVGHNLIEFDMPFIQQECVRTGIKFPKVKCFDTMLQGRWACAWGKVPSLQELCWACDVEYDPAKAHAAEYDVAKTVECFLFGVRTGFFDCEGMTTELY